MLTARDAVGDRVAGLDAGADDYLRQAVRARGAAGAAARAAAPRRLERRAPRTLRFADLELDPVAHEVRRGGRLIELTRTEFLLLELFLRHPRQVLTREQIFDARVGLRLRPGLQLARGLRRLSAPQDRGGGRAAAAAHRARRRLRAARAAAHDLPAPPRPARRRAPSRWRSRWPRWSPTSSSAASCAAASTRRCASCRPQVVSISQPGSPPAAKAGPTPRGPGDSFLRRPPTPLGGAIGVAQATLADGNVDPPATRPARCRSPRRCARSRRAGGACSSRDATVDGVHAARPHARAAPTARRSRWPAR